MHKYKIYPAEYAAIVLAHEQHRPGVTPYIGRDYKTHYRRPDGQNVPEYDYYLRAAQEGRIKHDPKTGEYTITT